MSTQSSAISGFTAGAEIPVHAEFALCATPLPTRTSDIVIEKSIPDRQLRLSVRPVSIETDMPILYNWMAHEYGGPLLLNAQYPEGLEEYYSSLIASDISQPFMGLINDIPVCQMDIYKADLGTIGLNYSTRPGDYGLQLMVAPLTLQDNMGFLLHAFLDYFFSFAEVGRVLTEIHANDQWAKILFKNAGFHCARKIRIRYKSADLYICTNSSFRQHSR